MSHLIYREVENRGYTFGIPRCFEYLGKISKHSGEFDIDGDLTQGNK